MTLPIEILVHVSGPSRGADDRRYRNEACGVLDFEPVKRHSVLPQGEVDKKQGKQGKDNTKGRPGLETPLRQPVQPPGEFSSSLLKRLENTTPYEASAQVNGAFRTPLLPPRGPVKSSPTLPTTHVKATPQLLVERTPALRRPRTAPEAVTATEATNVRRRTQSDSWQTPPSEIPDSQPSQSPCANRKLQIASSPCLKRPFLSSSSPSPTRDNGSPSGKRVCMQGPFLSAGVGEFTSSDEPLPLVPTKAGRERTPPPLNSCRQARRRHSHEAKAVPPPSSLSKSSPISHVLSSPPTTAHHTAAATVPYEDLPLEIHPPRPPTSDTPFITHLTPSLQTISTHLSLSKYFNPLSQLRSPDTLERGHWLIPLTGWEPVLKSKFWRFLMRFVGEGRAGWGTWCCREFQEEKQKSGSSKENRDPGAGVKEIVKVYCWGEIVGEVWLLLFLGSSRKVKGLGGRWVDAAGEVVVQMS